MVFEIDKSESSKLYELQEIHFEMYKDYEEAERSVSFHNLKVFFMQETLKHQVFYEQLKGIIKTSQLGDYNPYLLNVKQQLHKFKIDWKLFWAKNFDRALANELKEQNVRLLELYTALCDENNFPCNIKNLLESQKNMIEVDPIAIKNWLRAS